jgi:peroxidase
LKYINRNFDGTDNNQNYPLWGSKSVDLQRLVNQNYYDNISAPWPNKPSARIVSNFVGELNGTLKTSRLGLNMLFTIWGQFLDHDITLTPTQPSGQEEMKIDIPMCDTHMDADCEGDQ